MTESDQTNPNYPSQDDTINLRELFSLLWGGRKLIIIITSVFTLCSLVYALSLTNYYKSVSVLNLANAPNEMAALSRYSGLASMAGISLPSGGAEQQGTIILNTIVSRVFLKHLLSFEDILPSIMAVKSYDSESKKLVFNSNIYDAANKQWLQAKPSYIETYDVYRGLVEVIYDWSVGIISVTVEHKSPIFAKEFLDLIIRETDALIRQKDLQQSSDAIEYLVSELSKTSLIDMKNSINQMVRSQLETQMMAQISTDYVLKIIEPPFIPEKKSKPNRSFFVVLGTILGLVLGIVLILTRHYYVLNATEQASRP